MSKLTVDQRKWQAEDDARILASAEEIKVDKTRLSAATKRAKVMVTEQTKQLKSIQKIAKK